MQKLFSYAITTLSVFMISITNAYSENTNIAFTDPTPQTINSYEDIGISYLCYNLNTYEIYKSKVSSSNCLWIKKQTKIYPNSNEINIYYAQQKLSCSLGQNAAIPDRATLSCSGPETRWLKQFIDVSHGKEHIAGAKFYTLSVLNSSPDMYLYADAYTEKSNHNYYLKEFDPEQVLQYLFVQHPA